MANPSSPTDLPPVRITHLFPWPVEGRDVSAVWKETPDDLRRLGLTDIPARDLDVRAHFGDGRFDPIFRAYSGEDGVRWVLVFKDGKETLVELTLQKIDYEEGDSVYSKLNPDLPYLKERVKEMCAEPILAPHRCAVIEWDGDPNGQTASPLKDIALFNDFTPQRRPNMGTAASD